MPPRLYNAGLITSSFHKKGKVYASLTEQERAQRDSNQWYLESYHYVHSQRSVDRIRADGIKVFLDSGAFSALTQGVKIDINKFCDYCHRNADIIEMVSVLDVIDFDDPIKAMKGSFKNLKEMERQGVKALPCYHQGEDPEALKYYVENYDYITIGGLVGTSTEVLRRWLDNIWEKYLTNADGSLKTKVHLFGITSLPLMRRYSPTSFDSSTWVQWARSGLILLPWRGIQLNISAKSSSIKQSGQHLDTYRPIETAALERELIANGSDPQRLRDTYQARWAHNIWAFPKYLELNAPPEKFVNDMPGLF